MKNLVKLYLIIIIVSLASCDLYRDWNEYVGYSEVYPICGEYYVRDFDAVVTDSVTKDWYQLYIYNRANNPTKDMIWIDNRTGHPAGVSGFPYKFKILAKADTVNLTFDVVKTGNIVGNNIEPLDSAITISISNSKIFRNSTGIEDPTPDSIYFKYTYYNKYGVEVITRIVAGHRKTGWEFPEYNDPM